ncbi:hypothetical protein M0811_08621 [Anaeramoeba ignava]|uniref:KN homeodomain domain-containing protein n=1 Tax=Anaeramoeba ignava TaxID=1746090 RepID=A0A9Q0LJD8_ANAIG|nr:hypothetical protein M0811_08621 [Anaeramoeba ignava]|eukprot:Anaeramoba_ignava/a367385_51.p1 GENE.a367385_51~~a367385_51.p1  ORF type:complete len:136 (+),score=53.04 a367385_51:120-527(+)
MSLTTKSHKRKPREESDDEEEQEQMKLTTNLKQAKKQRNPPSLTVHSKRILLIWLFYNIENPYPTRGEKMLLCGLANVTMAQANNFFINARRRILRPLLLKPETKEIAEQIKTRKGKKIDIEQIDFSKTPNISDL